MRNISQECICASRPVHGVLVREGLFGEMKGMGGLGDDVVVVNLDVTHVDDPGPFIPTYSAAGDGWIAGEVEARKGDVHNET